MSSPRPPSVPANGSQATRTVRPPSAPPSPGAVRPRPVHRPIRPYRGRTPARSVPLVEAEVSIGRLRLLGLMIVLALAALVTRLWYLQVVNGDSLREESVKNRKQTAYSSAPRGLVVDATGAPLITNGAQFTVFVDPLELPRKKDDKTAILTRLADLLKMTPDELTDVMKRNQNGPHNPVAVAEDVDQHTLARVTENEMQLPGISVEPEPMRRYPQGKYAAHVLGYIGLITREQYADPAMKKRGYRPTDLVGQAGLEKQYDALLDGIPGGIEYEVDARGRRQRSVGEQETVPGATLKLGIHLDVQKAAQDALGDLKGAAVAVDVRDGTVIALASNPSFNPNLLARRPLKPQIYKEQIAPGLFNRATSSAVPPGSTFKIVTAAAGLDAGVITPYTYKYCAGGMRIGRTFKKCHVFHGSVNLETALAASCDAYFYSASLDLGPDRIADWAHRFGLGNETGIDLNGDKKGNVPTPAWKRKMAKRFHNPDSTWYQGETASFAIGQGDLQCTPLQVALAYGAIANGGTVWEPHIVTGGIDASGKQVYAVKPKVRSRLRLAPGYVRQIQQGLRATIAGPRGTARAMNLHQLAIAGKTGSAEAGTKNDKISHGWFACYAPYDKPQIAICVFLEADGHNYHGGINAGPVAKAMIKTYFHVTE